MEKLVKRKPMKRLPPSREQLYTIWNTMHARCENPKHNRYHRYGGRGVKVESIWDTYPMFRRWALEAGFEPGLSIDRIDSNGNYGPLNCRWATVTEQNRNKGNNKLVLFEGIEQPLAVWAEDPRCSVSYKMLWERLNAGWDFETALITAQITKES